MNEYDTHAIQSELAGIGYSFVDDYHEADLVLVNTCAVRGKPVEKAQTLLGELRKEKQRRRGAMTIGLMGCLAQLPEGRRMGEKFAVDIMLAPAQSPKSSRPSSAANFNLSTSKTNCNSTRRHRRAMPSAPT